jgi:hypothetical protein
MARFRYWKSLTENSLRFRSEVSVFSMSTILLITVGGSPQPIITAIQSLNPDRTVFICSDGPRGSVSQVIGEGTPCEIRRGAEVVERLPNLPTHLGLGDRWLGAHLAIAFGFAG